MNAIANTPAANHTHSVELGGEVRYCNIETFQTVCDEMVKRYPGGKPVVNPITKDSPNPVSKTFAPVSDATLPTLVVAGGSMDVVGKARSEVDLKALTDQGFAPAQTIYARGSRVIELGVENARLERIAFEQKPLVTDYCESFAKQIVSEKRHDEHVKFTDLRLCVDGSLTRVASQPGTPEQTVQKYGPMTSTGFAGLLSTAYIGGHKYLGRCPTRLRAINVNNWLGGRDGLSVPEGDAKIRLRKNGNGEEVFAVTTDSYQPFDVDRIANAIRGATPRDARGSVAYDGERARFEVLFHSNVQPKDYVAGEFFKAGVVVRTDDTGGGSVRVSAVVWQNLCLNLIIIDESNVETARIRHVGTVEKLAERFEEGFQTALGKLAHFQRAWGFACEENVLTPYQEALTRMPATEALAAIFNGCIERELVPVRGKRRDVVKDLLTMYAEDESSATVRGIPSRAVVVNAFTRYAHQINTDTWFEDKIQAAAGRLLFASGKALPFEEITLA